MGPGVLLRELGTCILYWPQPVVWIRSAPLASSRIGSVQVALSDGGTSAGPNPWVKIRTGLIRSAAFLLNQEFELYIICQSVEQRSDILSVFTKLPIGRT